ncbi:hypothetical protein D3C80_1114510 [compost metagenome]
MSKLFAFMGQGDDKVWINPDHVEMIAPHGDGKGCVVRLASGHALSLLSSADDVAGKLSSGSIDE